MRLFQKYAFLRGGGSGGGGGGGGGAPPPISFSDDPYRIATVIQIDATGQSDGTGYATDQSFFANALNYVSTAAIASQAFEFNGSSDYIWTADQAFWTPSEAMTWEMFNVKFDALTADQIIWSDYHSTNGGHGWRIRYTGTALVMDVASTSSAALTTPLSYTWTPAIDGTGYDIAIGWDGADLHLYIDGLKVANAAYSSTFGAGTSRMRFGCDDGASGASPRNYFNGRFSAAKLTYNHDITANAATYQRQALPLTTTQGFTGSAAPNPTFSNVKLLLGFNGSDGATSTTDESSSPVTPTFAGNAQLDTAEKKFGTASLLLDGTGDYVALGNKADFQTTAGTDIVAEGWAYLAATGTGIYVIYSKRPTSGTAQDWQLHVSNRMLRLTIWNSSGSGITDDNGGAPFPSNRWVHYAVMRIGTDIFTILDGLRIISGTQSGTPGSSTQSLDIGRDRDVSGRDWNGWLDEMRIVRGEDYLPRTGYIPPTGEFPRS